ncbi:asparaginase domain-containing protein [Neisseria leonii]|uniref:Asparaginase domain-containing protein n=2 Tax=Neisseria leonii TaxID=2995413 RepID=A0A9X4E433_9NEIS|nr:asparaginase domain-containing protein [Neisseria sp. 51.81]MDD9327616.1 asparaginase domain-containing protein [Neisseria sp. 51.81]
MMNAPSKRIFVLYTGGTIGMTAGADGLRPDTDLVNRALQPFSDGLHFDWQVCTPLIDSSAVTAENWRDWLAVLREKLPHYDGALVLHGTDTMAYTANIFALALADCGKPVVMTGSQQPFSAPGSDAQGNLALAVAALMLARPQVLIAFDGRLWEAVGSSKVSTERAAGFANPHKGAAAEYAGGVWRQLRAVPQVRTVLPEAAEWSKVACYTLTPGFGSTEIARSLAATQAGAVILQSYGHGNTPSETEWVEAVRGYIARGGVVLNISQAAEGNVATVYAQGSALRQAGVIGGGRCNLETAVAVLTLYAAAGREAVADVLRALALIE